MWCSSTCWKAQNIISNDFQNVIFPLFMFYKNLCTSMLYAPKLTSTCNLLAHFFLIRSMGGKQYNLSYISVTNLQRTDQEAFSEQQALINTYQNSYFFNTNEGKCLWTHIKQKISLLCNMNISIILIEYSPLFTRSAVA